MTLDDEDLAELGVAVPTEEENDDNERIVKAIERVALALTASKAVAPTVNVAAPNVSVAAPNVNVAAPQVTVQEPVETPTAWRFQIQRDQFGRMEQILAWPTTIPG